MMKRLLSTIVMACCCCTSAWSTNITVSTDTRGGEDRIQVLRGIAEVLIKESQERITLKEGEELVVKSGGKTERTEINVQEESAKWKSELQSLGNSIQLNEIPEIIRQMQAGAGEAFKGLQSEFKELSSSASVSDADGQHFKKDDERFIGVTKQDLLILSALQTNIEKAMASATTPEQLAELRSYAKLIGDTRTLDQGYQNEVSKMLKVSFKTSGTTPTADQLAGTIAGITGDLDARMKELIANPSGNSQDSFRDAQDQANAALKELGDLSTQVQGLLGQDPRNAQLLALAKQIGARQSEIGQFLRRLSVVEISAATLTEIQQNDDELSRDAAALKKKIDWLKANGKDLTAEQYARAEAEILRDYERLWNQYLAAQQLYSSAMASASGQTYQTAEQAELQLIFERISAAFRQFGADGDALQVTLTQFRQSAQSEQPPASALGGRYDYLSWGQWNDSTGVANTINNSVPWIAGSLSSAAAIPSVGTATYSGQVIGNLNESGTISSILGSTALTANFAARSLTGSFDNLTKNGNAWSSATVNAGWGAGSNQINGTLSAPAINMNGTVSGNFFGPSANNVGGTWTLSGGPNHASGAFVADKK